MLPYELQAGLRYTRAKRRNHFISFISMASMIGIMLGVATLITVLSIMNGFQSELRTRYLSMAAHVTITSKTEGGLADWHAAATEARTHPQVMGAAPFVDGVAMVRVGGNLAGTLLRGIDPSLEREVSGLDRHIKAGDIGKLQPGRWNIALGIELAQALGVEVGDPVDLMIPLASSTEVLPRFHRFTVAAIFEVGVSEYDRGLVVIDLGDAQTLYDLGDRVTGVHLQLHDLFDAPKLAPKLAADLPADRVTDWSQDHANFFQAVATEKVVMFVILSLLVGIAAFNIVSTLIMVVQDKQADIAILRTLGASPRSIMLMFLVQGSVIGLVGTMAGVALGVLLSLNVETLMPLLSAVTGHQFLDPNVYYITSLPSDLEAGDVLHIGLLSLSLGLLSTLYPAWRASRVQPAEALRYE